MKTIKFSAMSAFAFALATVLFSCNSGDVKNPDAPADDTGKVAATPAVATKPQNIMVIMHKVANFAKWLPAFEANDSMQKAYGLHSSVLTRGVKDTNMVMLALLMDDTAKAKAFAGMPDLKAKMQKAGVIGMPEISYIDVQLLDSSTNNIITRVLLRHKVKDYDAWKKAFEGNKQVRADAGLIDRLVGYNISDKNSVNVVCAVSDMTKAEAFFASKDLKDKMAAAGVVGAPTAFFYNVVKVYSK